MPKSSPLRGAKKKPKNNGKKWKIMERNEEKRGKEMKKLNEIWKVKDGSKVLWKLQAPKGILTFKTKKQAVAWQNASK